MEICCIVISQLFRHYNIGSALGSANEFLKHSPTILYSTFAQLTNQSFERHEHEPSFTEGFLTPLQKPGKPRGPLKSLRPLCFLNGTRKILFMIVLRRIQRQASQYTGPSDLGKMLTSLAIAVQILFGHNRTRGVHCYDRCVPR